MVCGATGAGKTTYALASADGLGAVRFSIDQWMTALFWMDRAEPIDPDWAMARVRRCYDQIWSTSVQVLHIGAPVMLDLGFSTQQDRRDFAARATALGVPVTLHFVDVPAEERWRRVEKRNAEQGVTSHLKFDVTREMFDYVETLWEVPSEEEMLALNGVRSPAVGTSLPSL